MVARGDPRGPTDRGAVEVDPLTCLGTRAAALRAIEDVGSGEAPPALLAVFSLDGFDEYEALFGRLAGRTLIVKLAARLSEALSPHGACFRPRRDEFAAVIASSLEHAAPVLDAAVAGLKERATSVAVASAWGAVAVPGEAGDPRSAFRIADARLAESPTRKPRERRIAPPREL